MYYDGTRLLSQKDLNGNTPEIFMVCGNRSAGKTTWFNRYLTKRFIEHGEKFMVIYRYAAEMDSVARAFFGEIQNLFFPGYEFDSEPKVKGAYHSLYCNEEECGYAVALNTAGKLRRYSHIFSDVQRMVFDEFQEESGHYCPNELEKFFSLHTTVARGGGKQVRYVPVFMLSNAVSVINPYYAALGISARLTSSVKFLRGDGFVLEQNYNEASSRAQQESLFNRAFAGSDYLAYAAQNVYLKDSLNFIETPEGPSRYMLTLKYKGKLYGIRQFTDDGIIYCDSSADKTFPLTVSVRVDDHNINQVILGNSEFVISDLRYYFNHGLFRFKNIESKEAVMTLLSIH